ncbi:hypothetical protein EYF80_064158 [Liparis tanakae]|uniref:Uncharacterized protein n=1 Tax=Liparis tanakae TaxID=230148 RepID=A0A4Z2EAD4_9TELE|nr:hypothetical protein EYF80_064158 [Liparis tanakae]
MRPTVTSEQGSDFGPARPQQWDSAILSGRADWQVAGGVKTSGSLMPRSRSKKRVEVMTLLFLA